MKKIMILVFAFSIFVSCSVFGQFNYQNDDADDTLKYTPAYPAHEVVKYDEPNEDGTPKNVILLIGDGMSMSYVFAAKTANRGNLYMFNFSNLGFQTTHAADRYITDSAAAGTAIATGQKTYGGAIGVDTDTLAIENIREKFEKMERATGVVSTSTITHATPASFVAHQPSRNMYEAIASDFLKTNIDVFIGGGYDHFANRDDGRDLVSELEGKGYQVLTDIDDVAEVKEGKLAGLIAPGATEQAGTRRDDLLEKSVETALGILSNNPKGFFLMVEGSQLDWAGHNNHTGYLVRETLDFDRAVGKALEFAANNKETLVIVTSDHETGGFMVIDGDNKNGYVHGSFGSTNHTPEFVPVMAFGPGAKNFRGFYDNTDIPKKIMHLIQN
jgi:alkaline phosphatase